VYGDMWVDARSLLRIKREYRIKYSLSMSLKKINYFSKLMLDLIEKGHENRQKV